MRFKLTAILFLSVFYTVSAQSRFSPLERQYLLSEEASIHSKNNNLHTSIQPYFLNETKGLFNSDSLRNGVKYSLQRKNFFTTDRSNKWNTDFRYYDGVFYAKSRARTMDEYKRKSVDGCATFWKASR